jgi:hypothetical protein
LYLSKDTFDTVPEAVADHVEVVAVLAEDFDEVVGVVDEELDAVELVALMQIDQKPACRLFRRPGNSRT